MFYTEFLSLLDGTATLNFIAGAFQLAHTFDNQLDGSVTASV